MLVVIALGDLQVPSGERGFPLRVCVNSHTLLFGGINVNAVLVVSLPLILVMHKSSLEFVIS